MTKKTIETERLILRPLTIADAQDVFEWTRDEIVNKYMPYPVHKDVKQSAEWISSLGDKNEFGFCLRTTGKVIGAGSVVYREEYEAYELGYNLNCTFWGLGYATEASKAMIRWAYETLGAHDFMARHVTKNVASANVIKKCGFQFERFGQYARYDGTMMDASYYSLHLE